MKSLTLMSWNVNGLRAVMRKGVFVPFIEEHGPDILCLQETKAAQGQAEVDLPEYEEIWNSAERKGYSGTAVFTKIKPHSIAFDMPNGKNGELKDVHGDAQSEGRVIAAEFDGFYLVNVYTPNSKRGLERLSYRHTLWDPAFLKYVRSLEKKKPVVFCGDLNAAHKEIDIARPKENKHNAGFTAEEREGIDKIVAAGFVDAFRHLHPNKAGAYTWWSPFRGARERNIGWRIDYFFVSGDLVPHLKSAKIHSDVLGSDHCPVCIHLEI